MVLDVAISNLTAPGVLAFALGMVAGARGASLRLPDAITGGLSMYLLLAIGLKGGEAIRASSPGELVAPAIATLALGVTAPVLAFAAARRLGRIAVPDAAALAAHYGSVSIVTFTAAIVAVDVAGLTSEAYLPALVAILEVPGIAVAILLAHRHTGGRLGPALTEALTGKSVLLLAGGIVIGAVASPAALDDAAPLFVGLFPGLLALYLLDLGAATGARLSDVRKFGAFLFGYAIAMPIVLGALGLVAGTAAGLSTGGIAVLAVMAASASYIAAPAAVSIALPAANPALSMTAALGVTFPFNLLVGIPLLLWAAQALGT
ncbi:MAG TPA: sodium-dependent bicarbonate transport family permease [Acidimicrobiia bacterium]|nr:sodium-dependent bicarbonate transport family permease [Acidimicrobiia bacterium]